MSEGSQAEEEISLEEELEEEYEEKLDLEEIECEEPQDVRPERGEVQEVRKTKLSSFRSMIRETKSKIHEAVHEEEATEDEEIEEEEFKETDEKTIPEEGMKKKPRDGKFWWRTSRYNLDDDFELPDDPEKANVKLQAILVEELKKRHAYSKRIANYFISKQSATSEGLSVPKAPKDLQKEYYEELANLKEILIAFSDTYDDLNFKLTKLRKSCDETEKMGRFFVDASRKILTDAQKKVDKSELDLLTKKKGLEPIIDGIYKCEDRVGKLMVEKAFLALEMEQTKYLLGATTLEEDVDILQLAELKRQLNTSTDFARMETRRLEKMEKIVSQATSKIPQKFHQLRYEEELKSTAGKDILKLISEKKNEREEVLKKIERKGLLGKKCSLYFAKKKLHSLEQYFKQEE